MIIKFTKIFEEHKHSFVCIADAWAAEAFPQLAYRTLSCYKAPLMRAKKFFLGDYIEDITHAKIKEYMEFLVEQNYSKKTIKNYRIVLSMIFKYAVVNDIVSLNLVSDVSIPKGLKSTRRKPPTELEIEKIKSNVDYDFGLFYYFLLYTGIRRGEALALTYEDIDWNNELITINKSLYHKHNQPHIKMPKTESGIRNIPLLQPLKKVLDRNKRGIIFSNDDGEYMTASQVETKLKWYRRATGISCSPHQLRHEFATILLEADIVDKDAQELLGHAQISTTKDIYMHITPKRLKETANKLNQFLS